MPELPPDLVGALGEARDAVHARHVAPQPRLQAPLATKAEHQAWVDRQLQPWQDRFYEVRVLLNSNRPELPDTDADESELAAFERRQFVHSVLSATVGLDDSIVRVRIPYPRELQQDTSAQADLRDYTMSTLGRALETAALWKSICIEYAGGYEPLPQDLEPWARHCTRLVDALVESVCEAEKAHDLPASVPCGGERPIRAAKPQGDDSVLSMEEIIQRTEQALLLCDLAEDVVDDDTIAPAQRVKEWRDQFEDYGINLPVLVSSVDEVLTTEDRADAAARIVAGVRSLGFADWECAAIEALFER